MASKKVSKDGPDLTSLRNKIEEIKNKYPFYNIHPGLLESFARENKIDVDIKNLCDEITTNGTSNRKLVIIIRPLGNTCRKKPSPIMRIIVL